MKMIEVEPGTFVSLTKSEIAKLKRICKAQYLTKDWLAIALRPWLAHDILKLYPEV